MHEKEAEEVIQFSASGDGRLPTAFVELGREIASEAGWSWCTSWTWYEVRIDGAHKAPVALC